MGKHLCAQRQPFHQDTTFTFISIFTVYDAVNSVGVTKKLVKSPSPFVNPAFTSGPGEARPGKQKRRAQCPPLRANLRHIVI
jgi:hypothetical protein